MNTIQKQTLIEIAALIAAVALTAVLSGCTSAPELSPEPSGETVPVPRFAPEAPEAPEAPNTSDAPDARARFASGSFAGLTAPGTALPGLGFPDARPAPSIPSTPAHTTHRAAAEFNRHSASQGD